MLTKHLQIMDRFNGGIKQTWHHNVTVSDLTEITKCLKTDKSEQPSLQACASPHRAYHDKWIIKLQGWHDYDPKTCRYVAQNKKNHKML